MTFPIYGKIKNVPNHQPAIIQLKLPFIVDLPIKYGDFPFILPYYPPSNS
jgi:hypothetical protein